MGGVAAGRAGVRPDLGGRLRSRGRDRGAERPRAERRGVRRRPLGRHGPSRQETERCRGPCRPGRPQAGRGRRALRLRRSTGQDRRSQLHGVLAGSRRSPERAGRAPAQGGVQSRSPHNRVAREPPRTRRPKPERRCRRGCVPPVSQSHGWRRSSLGPPTCLRPRRIGYS